MNRPLDSSETSKPVQGPATPVFNFRLSAGLLGILLAAMVSGLNNRVPGLVLADIQGVMGFSHDSASWLTTAYSAGELAAMPFATWFAITFSLRRFHLTMLLTALLLSLAIPFVQDLYLLLILRALQGIFSGALIPCLMMAALRFLPLSIRLHGLALYALTATFSPNVAIWLATLCVDKLADWRWIYWHVIPIGLIAALLVAWGVPKMPTALPRLKDADWFGMLLGIPGVILLVVGLDQGVRLDWFNSPIIIASFMVGGTMTLLFLISEWRHPAPFVKLQILKRRNLGLGFTVFTFLLILSGTAVTLPTNVLSQLQGFRLEQSSYIGLIVGLPQLILGSCVALLLYQKWTDARILFSFGLLCISMACWMGSGITSEWMVHEFLYAEILYMLGLPLTIIPLLFLSTSVVQPMEGPYVSGIVNILRAISSVLGGALIGQLTTIRTRFHSEMLMDKAGYMTARLSADYFDLASLSKVISQQASVLATADVYRIFSIMALLLIPVVMKLNYIPAPIATPVQKSPVPKAVKIGK